MLRQLLFSTAIFSSLNLLAQSSYYLDQNNAHAYISDHGVFFSNIGTGGPGYEIPAGSDNHPIYAMSFWMGGLDDGDQLHLAAQTYGYENDLFAGPIANDYSSSHYTDTYFSSIWKITKAQIDYHKDNFNNLGYTPSNAILKWPGNGNTTEGIAAQLAPYVDVNGDEIYNPMDGDYPYIQGDQAVYVIMNDVADEHTNSNADSLGIEIHVMFYQFSSSNADLNNTTFMNVKLYNRSSIDYHDFHFGLFTDYDLSNPTDDFIGCDSARNLSYVYNSSDSDLGAGGQPGYTSNTPAFGSVLLSESLGTFLSYNNSGGANGDPSSAIHFYNYLRGYWGNGAHLLYGGNGFDIGTTTNETNFMNSGNPFLGTGWNEVTEGNPSGDRRGVMSTNAHDLPAGSSICFDFAFVYNRSGNNHLENVNELLNTADDIQNYYNNNIQPCNQIFLDAETDNSEIITIYPNPSNGIFYLNIQEDAMINVYNLNGEIFESANVVSGSNELNLNLPNGIYILQIKTNGAIVYKKIEIIK